jgi:hypothetical protein
MKHFEQIFRLPAEYLVLASSLEIIALLLHTSLIFKSQLVKTELDIEILYFC